jgi:hypothetical protein
MRQSPPLPAGQDRQRRRFLNRKARRGAGLFCLREKTVIRPYNLIAKISNAFGHYFGYFRHHALE